MSLRVCAGWCGGSGLGRAWVEVKAEYVELINGEFVRRDAREWAAECLARHVLNIKSLSARQAWLFDFEKKHGPAEAQKLRDGMQELWDARK